MAYGIIKLILWFGEVLRIVSMNGLIHLGGIPIRVEDLKVRRYPIII
jgi:hypothetical protein